MGKYSTSWKVVVKFHAGYKGEEEPRQVTAGETDWIVEQILERSRISDYKTGQSHEEFTCLINKKHAKLSIYPNGQHYMTFLKS